MTDGDVLEEVTQKNNSESSEKDTNKDHGITKDIPMATEAANWADKIWKFIEAQANVKDEVFQFSSQFK